MDLFKLLVRTGRPQEATPIGRSALELTEKLIAVMADRADDSPSRVWAIDQLTIVGVELRDAGEYPAAEKAFRKALELMQRLAADAPADAGYQHRLADTHYNLAQSRSGPAACGRRPRGTAMRWPPTSGWRRPTLRTPITATFSANAKNRLGTVSRRLPGQAGAAVRLHREAVAIHDQLRTRYPDRPRYRRQMANSQYSVGLALWIAGRWAEAEAAYREALAALAPVTDQAAVPIRASIHNDWAWVLATCPEAKFRDPRRAAELARKAVELDLRPSYWNTLGAAQYRAGNFKASLAALEKSMAACKGGDSFDWFFVAMAHWQLGDKDEAGTWYGRAVAWMDEEPAEGRGTPPLPGRGGGTDQAEVTRPRFPDD